MIIAEIAFFVIAYLFAGSACGGHYMARVDDDDDEYYKFVSVLIVIIWPFYITFLPLNFVYKEVKSATEYADSKKRIRK